MRKFGFYALVVLGIAYVGWQEYRMNRIEASVQKVNENVQQIHQEVKELKTEIVQTNEKLVTDRRDADCLARNVFYEAGVEDKIGMVAVANVTLNRLKSGRWGHDICRVVYAHAQFGWTLEAKKRWREPKGQLWREAQEVAKEVLDGARVSTLNGSMFYHTDYVATPKWAKPENVMTQIGQHIFYSKEYVVFKPKKKPKSLNT